MLVPVVFWFGAIATGIGVLYYELILQFKPMLPLYEELFSISAGFWGSTTLLNAFSTSKQNSPLFLCGEALITLGMILWKIWSVQKAWKPPSICSIEDLPQRNRLNFALRNIVESGLIYTFMTFLVFTTHFLAASAVLVASAAVSCLVSPLLNPC